MKYVEPENKHQMPRVELSERNLKALLEKLQDPNSERTLIDPDKKIAVRAVPDMEHYANRLAGPTYTNGVLDVDTGLRVVRMEDSDGGDR